MSELAIIIPTHNRAERLRECLVALGQQTCPPDEFEVIVVVDGSTDNTRAMLETLALPFKLVVQWQAQAGQIAALNAGIQAAASLYCLFLDDDIVPGPELVAEHLRAQRAGQGVMGIGHLTLLTAPNADWFSRQTARAWAEHYERLVQGDRPLSWKAGYSGNLSAPRAALVAAGGFATDIQTAYDVELAFRLQQAGVRPVYLPAAAGEHNDPKDLKQLLIEKERQGRAYTALATKHPPMLPELLGRFGDSNRMRLALRGLLALDVPPAPVAGLRVLFTRPDLTRRYFDFLQQYALWRGVRHSMEDQELWRRVTSQVPILMYHSFGHPGEPASRFILPIRRFAQQLGWLRRLGYRTISLERYLRDRQAGKPPPARSVILTIDDGYADNYALAYPLLRQYAFTATIFLVSDMAGRNTWDTTGPTAGRPTLSWAQIHEMQAQGIEFGAHTRNHPRLTDIPSEAAQDQIGGSRAALEQGLAAPVTVFAYPFGKNNPQVRAQVEQAGFLGACTTLDGANDLSTPKMALNRIEVEGTDSLARFIGMLVTGRGKWWPRIRPRGSQQALRADPSDSR